MKAEGKADFAAPVVSEAAEGMTRLILRGDWTTPAAAGLERALHETLRKIASAQVVFDASGIARIDTAGAWLIEESRRILVAAGREVRILGLKNGQGALFKTVEKIDLHTPVPPPRPFWPLRFLALLGQGTALVGRDALALLSTLGAFTSALLAIFTFRRRLRFASLVNHIDRTGLKAVPIVALMSFLIGMIIAQQGAFYFRTYGAEIFVVDLVGVLVCREIGVLLTAIMVAGRSGSAFTAEIGSMKMREEIDALTVLGLSPVDVLVVPRLMALILVLPILTLVADLAALAGSWLVVVSYIGIPSDTYFLRLREALTLTYVMVGLVKAPAMALIIGLIACIEGAKVKGSAESLGAHTTASVVKAIFMVIVMDGVFAIFFGAIDI